MINWNDPKAVGHGILGSQIARSAAEAQLRSIAGTIGDFLEIEATDGRSISPCRRLATICGKDDPIILDIEVRPLVSAMSEHEVFKLHAIGDYANYSGQWKPITNYQTGSTRIKLALEEEARS